MTKKLPLNFAQFPGKENDLDAKYVWQIWILKTSGSGIPTVIKLLYSWVVPTHLDFKGWQSHAVEYADNITDSQNKNIKIELLRADYYGSGTIIRNAIIAFFSKQLSEIEWDNQDGFPPNAFLNLTLAAFGKDLYVVRPEVMIPVEHMLIPWSSKAIPSPVGYSIFVSQMVNLDKISSITFYEIILNKKIIRKVVKEFAKKIEDATGFDITRSSAPRIGNIEWYRLPISDMSYKPFISCRADKTGEETAKGAIVSLNPLPDNTPPKNISIRCRIINGEEVTNDELRDVVWGNDLVTEVFASEQPVCDIAVTIWKNENDGRSKIIFEDYHTLLRQIGTNMSTVGSVINSGRINMLDKLTGKESKDKPVQLAQYHRSTLGSSSVIGGYEVDPWVDASRESIKLMKGLFPEKSDGHFFLNGWDEHKRASGQLSFVEWMFEIISGGERGGLILIDPFFDMSGLEIFGNARTTNTHFRIVTCTQHRDKTRNESTANIPNVNDDDFTGEKVNQHATELTNACEKMRPLLRGLEFYLLDLRSKAAGKRSLFHDRYMLLTNASGIAKKGFHLSNSIQGATRNEPLLVTPIPEDILPEVLDYVESLIDPGGDQQKRQTEIITLYSSKEDSANSRQHRISANKGDYIDQIPNAGFFFSKLLGDISLLTASKEDLLAVLTERRLYSSENHFHIYNITPEQLECFFQFVGQAEQEECNELMSAWGNMLTRGHSFDHSKVNNTDSSVPYDAQKVAVSIAKQYGSLAERIITYLDGFNDSQQLIDDRGRFYSIFRNEGFEGSLVGTARSLNYMSPDCFVLDYGLMYASKLLVKAFPIEAVNFLDKLILEAEAGGWNEGDSIIRARLHLLAAMASHVLSYGNRINIDLQEKLLTDKNESVRAASVAALHSSLPILYQKGRLDCDSVIDILRRTLSDEEFRVAIAFFISNLEVRNNTSDLTVKEKLFASLLNEFQSNISTINNIARILGGALPFNRAQFITKNFLNPLVSEGVLTPKGAYLVWHRVFVKKIQYRTDYRDNGSRDYDHTFCSNTDTELTVALLNTFLALPVENQSDYILEWISSVKNIWPPVNRPFAESNFHTYSKSAERLFWVHFVIKTVYESGHLSPEAREVAETFLQKHSAEMMPILEFIRNRMQPGVKDIETITVTEP